MPKKPANKTTEAKKIGRPARAGGPGSLVSVRLTAEERETYQAAAERAGVALAEWIRRACAAAVGRGK